MLLLARIYEWLPSKCQLSANIIKYARLDKKEIFRALRFVINKKGFVEEASAKNVADGVSVVLKIVMHGSDFSESILPHGKVVP